jgi:Flp pilus assembly protein TadG
MKLMNYISMRLFGAKCGTRSFLKDESGQTLVLTGLSMSMLMGFMGLAIDVGQVHWKQRQLQTAADAAAIAAGLELGQCSTGVVCSTMSSAASASLYENGLSASLTAVTPTTGSSSGTCAKPAASTGVTMSVNVSPCFIGASDPNYGNTNMAEVVLSVPQRAYFGAIFGIPSINITVHSEAGEAYIVESTNGGGNCIYTKSLEFNSSDGKFQLTNCGIYDDGNLQTDDHDGVTASSFLYYGNWSPNNCNSSCVWNLGNSQTQPSKTTTEQTDPLASLSAPSVPNTKYTGNYYNNSGTMPLSPGNYTGDFNINGGTVNLAPGLYYFSSGSFNVDNGATLECTACTGGQGVTLYFTSGSLQMNSGSTVNLTAPSTGSLVSGDVANMLVWESSSNGTTMAIDTGSTSTLNGVIYLPDAQLVLNSGANVTINNTSTATALDVKDLMVDSGETFVINGGGGYLGGGSGTVKKLGSFALAE